MRDTDRSRHHLHSRRAPGTGSRCRGRRDGGRLTGVEAGSGRGTARGRRSGNKGGGADWKGSPAGESPERREVRRWGAGRGWASPIRIRDQNASVTREVRHHPGFDRPGGDRRQRDPHRLGSAEAIRHTMVGVVVPGRFAGVGVVGVVVVVVVFVRGVGLVNQARRLEEGVGRGRHPADRQHQRDDDPESAQRLRRLRSAPR